MTSRVVLVESEEGFAAFCPAFPGCVSQGMTEAEALDHIREAATLWLEAGGVAAPDGGSAYETELLQEATAERLQVRLREIGLAAVV